MKEIKNSILLRIRNTNASVSLTSTKRLVKLYIMRYRYIINITEERFYLTLVMSLSILTCRLSDKKTMALLSK